MYNANAHIAARTAPLLRGWLAGVALALLAVAVYAPVFSARLLLWDDASFITHNYRIQRLAWAYTADLFRLRPHFGPHPFGLYTPLTELSAAIEYHAAGARPCVYHTTNVALHIVTLLLVWRLMCALSLSPAAAWLGAAAFAVHPLNVESVAWVAERKNVLCGLWCMLALLLHVQWRRTGHARAYLACMLAGLCALLSKPAAVTLPLALLAYDVWYLRLRFWSAFRAHVPLLICASAAAMANVYVAHEYGAVAHATARIWIENLGIAARGLCWYVWKFIAPLHLAPVYPRGEVSPRMAWWLLGAAALGALIVWTRRRAPLASLGLLWYVIISLPTLQLVSAGLNVLTADRFFYLPGIGVLCAAAWLWQVWQARCRRSIAWVVAFTLLAVWAVAAHTYARVWHDDVSLWAHTARRQPHMLLAQKNLAIALHYAGRTNEASRALRAVAQRQHDYRVLTLLAEADYMRGNATAALAWAHAAVVAAPHAPEARFIRAVICSALGRLTDATNDWYAVLARQPLHPDVHHRLAYDLLSLGDTNAALAAFQAHLARHPAAVHLISTTTNNQ